MQTMSYNGWKNYETWAANLWISNDQGWYYEVKELTHSALTDADGDKDEARRELADSIKSNVDDNVFGPEDDVVSGLAADLLRAAFGEIDFHEIAEHWIADEYDAWREERQPMQPSPRSPGNGGATGSAAGQPSPTSTENPPRWMTACRNPPKVSPMTR